jgi:hypothetical protein
MRVSSEPATADIAAALRSEPERLPESICIKRRAAGTEGGTPPIVIAPLAP